LAASSSPERPLVLFDGVCNLCNASVDFILERDRKGTFRFAALQSEAGQRLLRGFELPTAEHRSLVLVEGDRVYLRSSAALRIARRLGGLWPALYLFIVVPPFLRDLAYDFVARNRYRWFGKRDTCRVPTPELADRFLS
jgi:predicted DCC family thiol-disulfide oxidoreductase YuxK